MIRKKKILLTNAFTLLLLSSLGYFLVSSVILLLMLIAIASVAISYFLSVIFIPTIFPHQLELKAIFIGGAPAPPYLRQEEIYRPIATSVSKRD